MRRGREYIREVIEMLKETMCKSKRPNGISEETTIMTEEVDIQVEGIYVNELRTYRNEPGEHRNARVTGHPSNRKPYRIKLNLNHMHRKGQELSR